MVSQTASFIPLHQWVRIPLENYPYAPSVRNTLTAPPTTQARASTKNWAQTNLANVKLKSKEGTVNDPEDGIEAAWKEFQEVLQKDKSFLYVTHILKSGEPYNEASIRSAYAAQVIEPIIGHLKADEEAAKLWGITDIQDAWASIGLGIELHLEIAEEDQTTTEGVSGDGSVRVDTMSFFRIRGIKAVGTRVREQPQRATRANLPARAAPAITALAKQLCSKRGFTSKNLYLGFEQVWLDEILEHAKKYDPKLLHKAVSAIGVRKTPRSEPEKNLQDMINLIDSVIRSKVRGIAPSEYKKYGYLSRKTLQAIAQEGLDLGNSRAGGVGILQQGLRYTCAYGSRNILYIDYHGTTAARVPSTLLEDWKASAPEGALNLNNRATESDDSDHHEVWWTHAESSKEENSDHQNAKVKLTIDGQEVEVWMTARLLAAFVIYLSIKDIRDWTDAVLEAFKSPRQ